MQSAKDRERERERQFHQLKKRGDGGNIVNGCSIWVWRFREREREKSIEMESTTD